MGLNTLKVTILFCIFYYLKKLEKLKISLVESLSYLYLKIDMFK